MWCLKTIDEIGPHEDWVLFQAGQYTALSSVGILVWKVKVLQLLKKSVIMGLTVEEIFNILKDEQTITL